MTRERSEIVRVAGCDVEVVWSARRKRTVSATKKGGRIVIRAPARGSRSGLEQIFERLVVRVSQREERAAGLSAGRREESNHILQRRAERLAARYFGRGALPAFTIEWSNRMTRRFGVCLPESKIVRLSAQLASVPDWVLDYLIVHELAHLIRGDHSAAFWELVSVYPRWQQARGFLQGVGFAGGPPGAPEDY